MHQKRTEEVNLLSVMAGCSRNKEAALRSFNDIWNGRGEAWKKTKEGMDFLASRQATINCWWTREAEVESQLEYVRGEIADITSQLVRLGRRG
jgi:hypothetical protein